MIQVLLFWKQALDFQVNSALAVFAIAKTFVYDLLFSGHHTPWLI